MSHTNSTTYYGLPQFVTTDKPAWLTDVNTAFAAVDTGIHNAKAAADAAQSDATQALSDASSAGTTATAADSKGSGAVASIAATFDPTETYAVGDLVMYNNLLYKCHIAVIVPGSWTGSINWSRTTMQEVTADIPVNIGDLDDVSTSEASTGDSLIYENGSWKNAALLKVISLGGNSTATIECQPGSIIILGRESIDRKGIWIIDGWGNVENIISDSNTATEINLSYSSGNLTLVNTAGTGRTISVIRSFAPIS